MHRLLWLLGSVTACGATATPHVPSYMDAPGIAIIPQPSGIHRLTGEFHFRPDTVIVATGAAVEPASVLVEQLAPALAAAPRIVATAGDTPAIELAIDPSVRLGDEGYRLAVSSMGGVHILAATPTGLFYGTQTLRQLL